MKKDPTHIFLVEDDAKLSTLIKRYLERHQFVLTIEKDGNHAAERILKVKPVMVILDILLPGKDGRTICRDLREQQYNGPIVMLTALDERIDQIVGLEIGADEYITKPVDPSILLSKINALLRFAARTLDASKKNKSVAGKAFPERIVLGDFDIHIPSRTVLKDGRHLNLTSTQFDLLVYLAANAGKIISRDRLFQQLRGIKYDGYNRSIDSIIVHLREKIGDSGKYPHIIKSVRGEGYLMVKPI